MITMQQFFETVKYRITEGGEYNWPCYGPNAYQLSVWNGVHGIGGWSAAIVFSTKSQKVYEIEVCDYTNNRAYRLINPKNKDAYNAEVNSRGLGDTAWGDVEFIDLDVELDFLEKLTAIVNGVEYDTRVQIQVNFTDAELMQYMTLAHQQDITFNQFIEQTLRAVIEQNQLNTY